MPLEKDFPSELVMLQELFGFEGVTSQIRRLNEIHAFAEAKWQEYVSQLPGGVVRHLLIAEAPPWRDSGPPWFVLDPASPNRTIMRALKAAFLTERQVARLSAAEALSEFARRGVLVIDSIPFSMKYSSSHRAKRQYRELVARTMQTYFRAKVTSPSISWSPDVRVALAYKLNALAVIDALDGRLTLGDVNISLDARSIAANRSGFPDAGRLRAIYGLS